MNMTWLLLFSATAHSNKKGKKLTKKNNRKETGSKRKEEKRDTKTEEEDTAVTKTDDTVPCIWLRSSDQGKSR